MLEMSTKLVINHYLANDGRYTNHLIRAIQFISFQFNSVQFISLAKPKTYIIT